MHRIKRQAKRNAWYNEDGSRNLNPFGKLWRPSTRQGAGQRGLAGEPDIEAAGVKRAQTTGDANLMSSADERRLSQWDDSDVRHTQTLPNQSGQRLSSQSEHGQSTTATEKPREMTGASGSESNGGVVGATEEKPTKASTGSELRSRDPKKKRKMGGLLGKLKGNHDEEEVEEDEKDKKPPEKFTFWSQIQHTIFNSPINILLILSPVGIAVGAISSIDRKAAFVINFIAIIPLAGLLSFATEEIALRVGETLGGLLNATFGNAVELIVSLLALFQKKYIIVQTSLVGSMLSNLLLVMGMCFFFGGLNKVEQHFNVTVAQTAASLLALAIGSLIIPTVFNEIVGSSAADDPVPDDSTPNDPQKSQHISEMSHGTAILLLVVYGAYLYFQLSTHANMYNEPSQKAERRKPKHEKGDALKAMMKPGQASAQVGTHDNQREDLAPGDGDDEEEIPKLSRATAFITLCGATALIALNANYMTEAIGTITGEGGISQEFVGLILLPIVGNAAEHATAVTVAVKDKMDLAIGVAVGSSMQANPHWIALLVLPLVIVIGWIADKDLTLAFDGFQVIVLFVSVLLVNYLIGDGKSHWLEGVLLQILYLIIAIAAWFYPTTTSLAG